MTAGQETGTTDRDSGTSGQRPARASRVSRRALLLSGGGLAVGAGVTGTAWAIANASASAPASAPAQAASSSVIPPDDDLMREHGVLKRVLLCYRELIGQIQGGKTVSPAHMQDSALIIHDFIEGFHEGLEEGYVFPRVRSQREQLAGTVTTLLTQHARGRVITQFILAHTAAGQVASPGMNTRLAAAMQAFVTMYEPHEAREDTVIFPAFRQIVPAAELADLGQHFTDLEHQQFGTDEFTAMVGRVAGIEEELGIYDLNQFTPQITPYMPQV
jgi:hemerythrin-like domain-containing protein